jgi:hypothetical protein
VVNLTRVWDKASPIEIYHLQMQLFSALELDKIDGQSELWCKNHIILLELTHAPRMVRGPTPLVSMTERGLSPSQTTIVIIGAMISVVDHCLSGVTD